MKDLTHKIAQFFSGDDFAEHGENARLSLTPAELRQIANLLSENTNLKIKLGQYENAVQNIKNTLHDLAKSI